MEQRLNVITLGVSDLLRSRRFYCEGLGFRSSSSSNEHVVFIDMRGVVLALYPRTLLAEDAQIDPTGSGFGGITLAQNVGSKSQVDTTLKTAQQAGATILKPAQDTFWGGYSGYFADPDRYPWEVAWNPHWPLTSDGRVELPE